MKERQFSVLIAAAAPEDRAAMRDALSGDPAIHFMVIEVESGLRALELRRMLKPNCLIFDHDLPDLSALEALKKLAAEEEAPACAVVVLVGAGDVGLAVESMENGAHGCLEKNCARGEKLLRAVSHAIENPGRPRARAEHERMMRAAARLVANAAAAEGSAAGSGPERADHKLADEQLRLLKTAIEQSNESVMIMTAQLDPPGPQIVYVNSAFTKMTGYTFEEVIGKTPRILAGPKTDRAVLERLRKDCATGKVFHGETIKYRKCITVSDTGAGIRSDFLPYVFDRFRQADASSVREYGGVGLGLSLVKYLVELHGGTIDVASEGEGRGTTFKILLPVRAIAMPAGEAGGAPIAVKDTEQAAMLAGVRALVVEDEDDARELIKVALLQYGAEVIAASSAADAYMMITTAPPRERPDVMVIDIGMPDENGYDLVRRLRAWERELGLHTPALALTAYGRVEDRVRALNDGFQMHVTKPVEHDELAAAIASLLRRTDRGEKKKTISGR
jgi:PAS domain S-box-containing protein